MCIFFPRRYLGKLKRYVSNRARPEDSIAKAYILKLQRLTFLKNVLTTGLCILMGSKLCIIEEKGMKILVNLTKGLIVFS